MVKQASVRELRGRPHPELVEDLKKLKEELQSIRFTKSTGTSVAKISKIKVLI